MKRLLIILAVAAISLVPLAGNAPVTAQSGSIWTAQFFNNPDWAGNPVLTQTVPTIWFNWGFGSPGANVPVDGFTGRFTTDAFFYAGNHRFDVTADDDFTLIVDGVTYLDTRNAGQSGKTLSVVVPMAWQGNHRVEVLYREWTQAAYIFVNWQVEKPGGGGQQPPPPPPPPINCGPQSETSVRTQFGDYTPCIQQGIHQVNCFQSNGAWNAPNRGSIETEPQIQVWRACPADSWTTFQVSCDPQVPLQNFKCSKTEAGYFPG